MHQFWCQNLIFEKFKMEDFSAHFHNSLYAVQKVYTKKVLYKIKENKSCMDTIDFPGTQRKLYVPNTSL